VSVGARSEADRGAEPGAGSLDGRGNPSLIRPPRPSRLRPRHDGDGAVHRRAARRKESGAAATKAHGSEAARGDEASADAETGRVGGDSARARAAAQRYTRADSRRGRTPG
jgi:hypothetical protein